MQTYGRKRQFYEANGVLKNSLFLVDIMKAIEKRALYNLLRMNWLNDPSLSLEPWQIEDYRSLPLSALFERLKNFNLHLDRLSFINYADDCDSPENLTDHFIGDRDLSTPQEDQIYLLIFELWRRLMNEKSSLSILCNELDHQIYLYDQQLLENPFALQDALAHFVQILEENVDEGIPPQEVLDLVSPYCANDIESFLYDFISDQIEEGNSTYAEEILEDFELYVSENKWFKLLRVRLFEQAQNKLVQKIIREIFEENLIDDDLEYHLEFLSLLAEKAEPLFFYQVLEKTLSLIKREEDLQDLLFIVLDYFHRLDRESEKLMIKQILEKRSLYPLDQFVQASDADLRAIDSLFQNKNKS